jgi:hypothetical protein
MFIIGNSIILAHGAGRVSLIKHANKPFKVVGIHQKKLLIK